MSLLASFFCICSMFVHVGRCGGQFQFPVGDAAVKVVPVVYCFALVDGLRYVCEFLPVIIACLLAYQRLGMKVLFIDSSIWFGFTGFIR